MRNLVIVLIIFCCSHFLKGNNNLNVFRWHSKIYGLGNDSIGWCIFHDDGSLLYRITDIQHGDFKSQCFGDSDSLVYHYQGQECSYSRTDSTLLYRIALLYWIDDFENDITCKVYRTSYSRLIRDIYTDIYNHIINDLNLSLCNIEVNENSKHIDRNKFCKLLTNSEDMIELELLKTNKERLRNRHNQNDEINIPQKQLKSPTYVLNISDIEDNMVVAELSDKDNFVLSSYLIILDNRGYIRKIIRL